MTGPAGSRLAQPPQRAGCALVTGASRGIGAASAVALAAAGWRCGINFRTDADGAAEVVKRIEADGGEAVALAGDVADPTTADDLFGRLERAFGPVLCLVNNAGDRADGLTAMLADEQWAHVLRVNLDGAFRLCRRAVGPMLRARWGRIVNIASVAGLRASPGQANYSAAKAGLVGLTRSLAVEVAARGVTVNAVAPGLVGTRLTSQVSGALVERIPARRPGLPEEIAACVAFLASAEASYVTGAVLPVDGGLSA